MPAGLAAVGVFGTIGGALIQGSAARSAARTQARASARAIQAIIKQTKIARTEILDRMVPALSEFNVQIQQAQNQIAAGTFDVMSTLQQYSGNADQIIANANIDSRKALMGSTAQASGIPMSQFNQTYSAAQNAPSATAKQQIMSNLSQAINTAGGARNAAQQGFQIGVPTASQTRTLGGTAAAGTPIQMTQNDQGVYTEQPQTLTAQATQPSERALAAGSGTLAGSIGGAGTGFTGAVQDITAGYGTAQNALDVATAQARGDVTGSTASALSQLEQTRQESLGQYAPYTEAGQAAIAKEAALSGAMGAEAQQAAINEYIESPGQAYLRQQQEKALLRNQAAIGGLGGGNVRSALQEQAMNIASTQQQQYLENLRSLATRGQEAAGATTNVIGQTGMYGAQLTAGAGNTLAQLQQQYGISSANLAQMSSSELADLAQSTGINIANLNQATSAARAALQTELGSSLASAQAGATSDIANLISQGATTTLSGQQNISQTLANLATQTGTNLANLQLGQGSSLAAGQYLQGQALASGLSGLGNIAMFNQYLNAKYPQSTTTNTTEASLSPYDYQPYGG